MYMSWKLECWQVDNDDTLYQSIFGYSNTAKKQKKTLPQKLASKVSWCDYPEQFQFNSSISLTPSK